MIARLVALLTCVVIGHDRVRVRVDGGPFLFPEAGLMMSYREDPKGTFVACRRCRRCPV